MNFFLDEYLDYLQESSSTAPAKFIILLGMFYAIFKHWQHRQEIINGYCKKYKGDPLNLDICVATKQIDNAQKIINQLRQSRHTCSDTRNPSRCQEKVRYYIKKYEDRIEDLQKLVKKRKEKMAKKIYKEKLRKIKKQYKKDS